MSSASVATVGSGACLHCGLAIPSDEPHDAAFCCAGCQAVYALLHDEGLTRYYDLGGARGNPARDALASARRDRKWLEEIEVRVAAASGPEPVCMDVQGIRCSACVWLIEELFRRAPGGLRAVVNPALGRVDLVVEPSFGLRGFVEAIERFGVLLGPPRKTEQSASDGLLVRTGICIALALNAMVLGATQYFGLERGPVAAALADVNFALALLAVLVGGWVFFVSAFESLRRGVLHLDVPIALGILLAFAGSLWSWAAAGGRAVYVDTVTVFIALMVLGRFLQARVVERNRRQLLASDGAEGVLTRRVQGGIVELVSCTRLEAGDEIVIAPGDLVPVDARLREGDASCSLDWIVGESRPRTYREGDVVPAGAFNLGLRALHLFAETDFAGSPLVRLLETPDAQDARGQSRFYQRVVRGWVAGVLFAGVAGFVGWLAVTGDVVRALEVATAVLVVTCPCGFGIATPLAYELAHAGLRRAGLFVRRRELLDRAVGVRRVVFDKTGTVTTGTLHVVDPSALEALPPHERAILYTIAVRSGHPKSQAVARALTTRGAPVAVRPEVASDEQPGRGLSALAGGHVHRLGAPEWAAPGAVLPTACDLVYAVDGVPRAALETAEALRPDARVEIARLVRDGYEVWLLSGDAPERVTALAADLGIPVERAVGGASPDGKAEWLAGHDHADTLMIGDGINDSLVVSRATCSGTPAVDRPFLPARTDFYFVTPGLQPVGLALRAARRVAAVVRRNLGWAVAYNIFAVGLAWAGLMAPWLAAILMPASSLAIVGATFGSLSSRSTLWRS